MAQVVPWLQRFGINPVGLLDVRMLEAMLRPAGILDLPDLVSHQEPVASICCTNGSTAFQRQGVGVCLAAAQNSSTPVPLQQLR
jgi:hypothetical protein